MLAHDQLHSKHLLLFQKVFKVVSWHIIKFQRCSALSLYSDWVCGYILKKINKRDNAMENKHVQN